MRILLVTQYFWPENFIVNDLIKKISNLGHQVSVLTAKPNYPDGKIFQGYEQKGLCCEIYNENVEVMRAPIIPRKGGSGKQLIMNYLSFVLYGLWFFPGFVKKKEYDVVFVFATSPITVAIPAIFLKYIKKAQLAIWVQDLWPESLAATDFIKNPLILKLVGVMVRCIYACADTLLVQSKAFVAPVSKYANKDKIFYYPNSFDNCHLNTQEPLALELKNLLENYFCIVFAGNIGKAQSLETLVEAAKNLKDLPNFRLVIVGSGSMLEWVKNKKDEYGLDNLVLVGRYPPSAMPQIYKLAAGLAVTLKDEEIFSYTIPSKIQAYLAAAKPILAAINGEGAKVVIDANAGFVCQAERHEELAELMRKLYYMSDEERQRLGQNGYEYFINNFEMNKQVDVLLAILKSRL
jgi:glycosyltransferase involved in cell wall biosynthesis